MNVLSVSHTLFGASFDAFVSYVQQQKFGLMGAMYVLHELSTITMND